MKAKPKMFTSAPLPFQGQKRRYAKKFSALIAELKPALVVDLFGGSGLLSHVAKRTCPEARVVYNDYDNYCGRLAHIDGTNALLAELRAELRGFGKKEKVSKSVRDAVLRRVAEAESAGYVDYITLSANLFFSMKYATDFAGFAKQPMYNRPRSTDYAVGDYLSGIEVARRDYRELREQYGDEPGALFVADPPYLTTDTKTYSSLHWGLKDGLDVIAALSGTRFVYFTSGKLQIAELCDWMSANRNGACGMFDGARRTTVRGTASWNSGYDDIMIVNG
jgi:hypothetical protein